MAIALLNDSELWILLLLLTLGRLSTIDIAVRESLFSRWDLDHLHLWLSHDLTLYVIVAVRLHSYQELIVILVDLILDLGAAKKKVLFHVLQSLQTKVHIDCWDTLTPVFLRSEDQVLFNLQLVNGLSPYLSCLILDKLSINVEPDTQ